MTDLNVSPAFMQIKEAYDKAIKKDNTEYFQKIFDEAIKPRLLEKASKGRKSEKIDIHESVGVECYKTFHFEHLRYDAPMKFFDCKIYHDTFGDFVDFIKSLGFFVKVGVHLEKYYIEIGWA